MKLNKYNLEVLRFLSEFKYATQSQLRHTIFKDCKSATSCDRVLYRLKDHKLIASINNGSIGGRNGGSGPNVWQLREPGAHIPKHVTAQMYHTLQITESYMTMVKADLNITDYDTEPDSHIKISYIPINPDLAATIRFGNRERRVWVEVDMGTEGKLKLKDKLKRYHEACIAAPEKWYPWPRVVWLVPDERRARELRNLIAETPKETQVMYRVGLFDEVVDLVSQ